MQKMPNTFKHCTDHSRQLSAAVNTPLLCAGLWLATAIQVTGQTPKERTWRDVTGKFSVEARLLVVDGESVKLLTNDGRQLSVPLRQLSARDRAFLENTSSSSTNKTTAKKVTPSATGKAIAQALAGSPLPATETALTDLPKLLPFPVFLDALAIEGIGVDLEVALDLGIGHQSLQDQLDQALNAADLSWCSTQTVFVVTNKKTGMRRYANTRFYHLKTPKVPTPNSRNFGFDYSSVIRRVQQISPGSWIIEGGIGDVVPIGTVYAIRQTPDVHRALVKAFNCQSVPHQYGHSLDSITITLSTTNSTIGETLNSIGEQIDRPIVVKDALDEIGYDIDTPIHPNLELKNVSAKDALDLILSQFDCTWVEDGKTIVLQADYGKKTSLSTQRFSLKPSPMRDVKRIIDAITRCVAPDDWEAFGGDGKISVDRPGLYLIQQTQPAMRELEQFMRELLNSHRRTK